MALGVIILSMPQQRRRGKITTLALLSFIVLASGPLFLQTNSLENRCQLASLWIIVLLDPVSELHLRLKAGKIATLALTAACLGGVAAALVPDVSSTLNLLSYNTSSQKASGSLIPAPGMEKMRFYDSTPFYDKVKFGDGDGTYYAETLNDGINLLNSKTRPDETILVLGFHNPFSYLLRRKPAAGGSSYLFVGNSMSADHMLPGNSVFDHADLMMLPENEGTHRVSDQFIQTYYRDDLLRNFDFVANSNYWKLYRRSAESQLTTPELTAPRLHPAAASYSPRVSWSPRPPIPPSPAWPIVPPTSACDPPSPLSPRLLAFLESVRVAAGRAPGQAHWTMQMKAYMHSRLRGPAVP